MESIWNYSQTVELIPPTLNQSDLQHPRNQPTPRTPMQDLSNHIQSMQRYPHPQMRIRRPFPMSDPGQLQTIQAVTQDPIRRIGIKLHHRN